MTNSITIGGTGPYSDGAPVYRDLGWIGVIPVQRESATPVSGYTGKGGKDPRTQDVDVWITTRANQNLGLRLPANVVVIDVDCYDGKNGCARLAELELELGELPDTWSSTSRQDGSRKLFFTAPFHVKWNDPGDGVEILHRNWRYARVWPSVNPKTRVEERWFDPAGELSETPPTPDVFPQLPTAWVARFAGERAVESASSAVEDGGERFPWNELLAADRIPPGDQDNLLARAARSCRATNDSDAVAQLKLQALAGKFVNDPGSSKGDWTPELIYRKWLDVKAKHEAGRSFGELPVALREFAEGLELTSGQRDALAREANQRWARKTLDERDAAETRGERVKRTAATYELVVQPRAILENRLAPEVNLLGGPSASGKSLLARDWAIEVALSGRNVLYVASEGTYDYATRWVGQPGYAEARDRIWLLDEPVNLTSDADVRWLLDEYAKERPALVVFDLIYDMGMTDDNGMKDLNPVFRACKKISAEWEAATLLVGHNNLDGSRRFRGSGSWRQRAYVEWHMANGLLTCEKSKIANKDALARGYELTYPQIRWHDGVTSPIMSAAAQQRELENRIVALVAELGAASRNVLQTRLGLRREELLSTVDLLLGAEKPRIYEPRRGQLQVVPSDDRPM